MSLTVTKIDVWAAQIEDKPGGLAKLLGTLADDRDFFGSTPSRIAGSG
jgi:hypothetical protein